LPAFAHATLSTAYTEALKLVDLTLTPSSSLLYVKSRDGHCGPTCSATTGNLFFTEMQRWFPAENTKDCDALTTPH
jgi:hypothetical protein